MLIVRSFVRLSALVAALALAGCGGGPGGSDCDPTHNRKGCVMIENWRQTPETFSNVTIAASSGGSPGLAGVLVSDTSVNSTHTFQGTIGGQNLSVTCTVTDFGWREGNPDVLIQPDGSVNCGVYW